MIDRLNLKLPYKSYGLKENPIIVFGMHRSGTTMMVEILQKSGVFMGCNLGGNLEPRVIQDANRQIFDYFDASWLKVDSIPDQKVLFEGYSGLAKGVYSRFSSDFENSFTCGKKYQRWGFKDPRLSLSAGLFLRIFQDAQAVFIYRNPLDVVLSIVTRELKIRRKHPGKRDFEFRENDIDLLLARSVTAWKLYNERAISVLPLFSNHIVVNYDTLVDSAKYVIPNILDKLNLSMSVEDVEDLKIERRNRSGEIDLLIQETNITNYLEDLNVNEILFKLNKLNTTT